MAGEMPKNCNQRKPTAEEANAYLWSLVYGDDEDYDTEQVQREIKQEEEKKKQPEKISSTDKSVDAVIEQTTEVLEMLQQSGMATQRDIQLVKEHINFWTYLRDALNVQTIDDALAAFSLGMVDPRLVYYWITQEKFVHPFWFMAVSLGYPEFEEDLIRVREALLQRYDL